MSVGSGLADINSPGSVVVTDAGLAWSIGAAVLLDAPTRRANPDWAEALGHHRVVLSNLIRAAVGVVAGVRSARYVELRASLPNLHVLGGCCGTDHRHVAAIAAAWQASAAR
jgi:hypothetical protein